ncbi:MAG: ABC transporter ATP-binding protein [Anaerolineae bacterium]|nr:ABC transporter ATP-binding protein [Anaerolineae bacterium]
MFAVEVNNLTRQYDDNVAVDHISFNVEAGEIFGFLGPNGAGKTTTIKMLTGQLRPSSGTATVCGYDIVAERQAIKKRIGVVFEYHNLYERMSARDNLRFTARLYGINGNRVNEVLRLVGLEHEGHKVAKQFSNGMQQRLLIARALLPRPEVLFLDEPTKGLDPGVARDIRDLVSDLKAQGVTIFLTTHYMEEADRLCDRIAILERGHIVATGTPNELKRQSDLEHATLEDAFLALTGRNLVR